MKGIRTFKNKLKIFQLIYLYLNNSKSFTSLDEKKKEEIRAEMISIN